MKVEELPGIPTAWVDFLSSRIPLLSPASGIEDLVRHVPRVEDFTGRSDSLPIVESLKDFRREGVVAIVADIYPGLFGGPCAQLLKCLTAAKLCEELASHSIRALPVGWIREAPAGFPKWSSVLIDSNEELQRLEAPPSAAVTPRVMELIGVIEGFGRDLFDPEILEMLKRVYVPGESWSAAAAKLFSELMKDWGMVFVDSASPEFVPVFNHANSLFKRKGLRFDEPALVPVVQILALPVLAHVADFYDIGSLVKAAEAMQRTGLPEIIAWPQAEATVGDSRARRILSRYALNAERLYSGVDAVLQEIFESLPTEVPDKLESLELEVGDRIGHLKREAAAEEFGAEADSCAGKITYQLERLRDLSRKALQAREETAARHIRRVGNLLAPNGRPQESELAAIQIPLSFSCSGLRKLYDNLDIHAREHQLIWMD